MKALLKQECEGSVKAKGKSLSIKRSSLLDAKPVELAMVRLKSP